MDTKIAIYDESTISYAKSMELEVIGLSDRLWRIPEGDQKQTRDPFFIDYARILHSSSFRRLQGKMQLLGIQHTEFFRNRLTHSLEVCQLSREIANQLQMEYSVVAEAASLAHDLGNPPFGHYGERVLHGLARDIGGFEGNAQTFRILTFLEKRHHKYGGLNLTLRTILGVVKYFRRYEGGEPAKFLYDSDYELVSKETRTHGLGDAKTIDMQIMDLADQIAYAAHDLEDCLKLGYFTIDELLHEFKNSAAYGMSYDTLKSIVKHCQKFAVDANTSEDFSSVFRRKLKSCIIDMLVKDVSFSPSEDRLAFSHHKPLAVGLKFLTFNSLLRRPAVRLYEKMGEKVIRGLYRVYTDENFNKNLTLLPPEYRACSDDQERRRNVIDYIAGMMDSYAAQEFERFYGKSELDGIYFGEM